MNHIHLISIICFKNDEFANTILKYSINQSNFRLHLYLTCLIIKKYNYVTVTQNEQYIDSKEEPFEEGTF